MLLIGEPQDAYSFTDETKLKNTEKTTRCVWIHAQISKLDSLDWFKELRGLYPEIQGELKSKYIEKFDKLPREVKIRVSSGIRKARIHIVDTFAYEAEAKQILRNIYKCDNYEKMLRQNPNPEVVKQIISGMETFVAESILLDSPSQRLEQKLKAKSYSGLGFFLTNDFSGNRRKELAVDLKPFRKGNKNIRDSVSKYVSKSGAVFSSAVEFARGFPLGEYETRQHIAEMLNISHAFDEGDEKSVKWIDGQRNHFITSNVYHTFNYLRPLYGNIDSRLSPKTQAADISSGFAEEFYNENGLQGVVDKFDYVTFNGEKINEGNIKERLNYWSQIVEREEKIQKFVSKI